MKTLSLNPETARPSLEALDEVIGLEAFTVGGFANRIVDLIPNLVYAAKKSLAAKTTDKIDLNGFDVNFPPLEKALNKADYLDIGSLFVRVPHGFQGRLGEYVTTLEIAVTYTNEITNRLTAFNQLLSSLISDKNVRQSTRDLATASQETTKEREAVHKQLVAFINPMSRISKERLDKTYRSCKGVGDTARAAKALVASAGRVQLADVERLVADAAELLDVLSAMAEKNQLEGLTPEALRGLSSATLTCARDVELHALMMHAVWQVKIAVEENAKELTRALRYE